VLYGEDPLASNGKTRRRIVSEKRPRRGFGLSERVITIKIDLVLSQATQRVFIF
jgi:hypothetical protein